MADDTVTREARRFYVYVVFRPNGVPCYVGKGSGDRWRRQPKLRNNPHLKRIAALSSKPLPIVIVRAQLTEKEAFAIEIALIAAMGREARGTGPLVNATDGGEGPTGYVFSADARARIAAKNRGRTLSPEQREAIGRANRGRIRHDLRGKPQSAEARAKRSVAQKGKRKHPLSAETRAKMSASRRGKKRGPSPLKGRSISAATKAAISAGWARRRQKKMEKQLTLPF